jgi:hypothetical protein
MTGDDGGRETEDVLLRVTYSIFINQHGVKGGPMTWTKAMSILLAVSVLAMPVPTATAPALAAPVQELPQDYASREAQAQDLEQFQGGFHGVIITLVVIGVLVWLFIELFDEDGYLDAHPHDHPPARP